MKWFYDFLEWAGIITQEPEPAVVPKAKAKKAPATKKPRAPKVEVNLDVMTKKELIAQAKVAGIKVDGRKSKAAIIAQLKAKY